MMILWLFLYLTNLIFDEALAQRIKTLSLTQDQVYNCLQISGVSSDEFRMFRIDDKPSLPLLCAAKCLMEQSGMLEPATGRLLKHMIANYKRDLPGHRHERALVCADMIQRIEKCDDLEVYRQCIVGPNGI